MFKFPWGEKLSGGVRSLQVALFPSCLSFLVSFFFFFQTGLIIGLRKMEFQQLIVEVQLLDVLLRLYVTFARLRWDVTSPRTFLSPLPSFQRAG